MFSMCKYYLLTYLILTTYMVLFLYTNEETEIQKVTQLVYGRAGVQTHAFQPQSPYLLLLFYTPFPFIYFFIVGNIIF